MIGPPLTASKQRTFSVEGIGPLPRSIVETTRGDYDDLSTGRCSTGVLGSWRAVGGRDVQEENANADRA